MSEGNGAGKKREGGQLGNQNAKGNLGNRKLGDDERGAKVRAAQLLNLASVEAVETLLAIMRNQDGTCTKMDQRLAAADLLDRTTPKMTQERILMEQVPKTLLEIPDALWPPALRVVGGD